MSLYSPPNIDQRLFRAKEGLPFNVPGITLESSMGNNLDLLRYGITAESYVDVPIVSEGEIVNDQTGSYHFVKTKTSDGLSNSTDSLSLALNVGATQYAGADLAQPASDSSVYTAAGANASGAPLEPVAPSTTVSLTSDPTASQVSQPGPTAPGGSFLEQANAANAALFQSGGTGTASYSQALSQSTSQAGPYVPNPVYAAPAPVTVTTNYSQGTVYVPSGQQTTAQQYTQSSDASLTVPAPPAPTVPFDQAAAIQQAQDLINQVFSFGFS